MAIMFASSPLLLSCLLSYITGSFEVTLKLMRTEYCDKTPAPENENLLPY